MKRIDARIFNSQIKIGKRKVPICLFPIVCGVVAVYLVFIGAILILILTLASLAVSPLF